MTEKEQNTGINVLAGSSIEDSFPVFDGSVDNQVTYSDRVLKKGEKCKPKLRLITTEVICPHSRFTKFGYPHYKLVVISARLNNPETQYRHMSVYGMKPPFYRLSFTEDVLQNHYNCKMLKWDLDTFLISDRWGYVSTWKIVSKSPFYERDTIFGDIQVGKKKENRDTDSRNEIYEMKKLDSDLFACTVGWSTQGRISIVSYSRKELLKEFKFPHVTSSIKFQVSRLHPDSFYFNVLKSDTRITLRFINFKTFKTKDFRVSKQILVTASFRSYNLYTNENGEEIALGFFYNHFYKANFGNDRSKKMKIKKVESIPSTVEKKLKITSTRCDIILSNEYLLHFGGLNDVTPSIMFTDLLTMKTRILEKIKREERGESNISAMEWIYDSQKDLLYLFTATVGGTFPGLHKKMEAEFKVYVIEDLKFRNEKMNHLLLEQESNDISSLLLGNTEEEEEEVKLAAEQGLIRVKIHQCRELMAADRDGKSDPFCVLKIMKNGEIFTPKDLKKSKGSKKNIVKTKIVKSTLDPVFDEVFEIFVEGLSSHYLHIEIMDWDRFSKDDPIGFCSVPLSYVVYRSEVNYNEMKVLDGKGTISFSITGVSCGCPEIIEEVGEPQDESVTVLRLFQENIFKKRMEMKETKE